MQEQKSKNIIFFGTSIFSVIVLNEMKAMGFVPKLIVTVPDMPKGRKLILTPPETKIWAEKESVPCLQLSSLRSEDVLKTLESYCPERFTLGVVASYGKIIPQNILDIPVHGMLNVHPSLLPRLRGASPIQSTILTENETGVTIIRLDAEMDHGPIIAQKHVSVPEWPPYAEELEKTLARAGGRLLAEIISDWIDDNIQEKEQDHSQATFCKKIEKEDARLDLHESPETILRKIRAYHVWPKAFFEINSKGKTIRVIVKTAHIENEVVVFDRVIPEGKQEMNYSDFLRG